MKNSLKLSRYLPHHYQDNLYNDYPGKINQLRRIFAKIRRFSIDRNEIFFDMCRLCLSNSWSISLKSRTGFGMACSMFEMLWMRTKPRWNDDMLCSRWQNLLQIWLYTVSFVDECRIVKFFLINYLSDWIDFVHICMNSLHSSRRERLSGDDTQRFHLVEWILWENMLLFSAFDSIRLFVSKCAKCQQTFSKNDLFIRTNFYRRFHPDCFRCDQCDRLLTSGDEYYLHRQNEILCRQHFQQLSFNETSSMESKSSCSDSLGISTAGKETYAVHTHWHPFGCDYGVKEGIDGMLFITEVRSVWGALFSR